MHSNKTVSAYIFVGPTVPPALLREKVDTEPDAEGICDLKSGDRVRFLPPVSEGDISRLIPLQPKIIGIIDGLFENVPSVWHKEILFAMSSGIHVIGSSSMGALRAAELENFGMEGVGSVFKAFSDGLLEDDDEVTVAHGPQALGFPLLSEAMVNIRRTLDEAYQQNIIDTSEKKLLLQLAKQANYKQRNYGNITRMALSYGVCSARLKTFQAWLKTGRVDQKLLDAYALIDIIVTRLSEDVLPKRVLYSFERTAIWEGVRTREVGTP